VVPPPQPAPPGEPDRPEPAGRRLGLLALLPVLALVVAALAAPISSGDLWWQVNAGRWMLEHTELPSTDPFSHTAGDRPWILEEYGSQLIYGLVHGAAGLTGLRVLGTVLALAVVLGAYRLARRQVPPAWAAAAAALFCLVYALKWELRPHLVSTLLMFWIAARWFPRSGARAPGPARWFEAWLLTAVWTQLHAESMFALLAAVAGLIGALLGAGWEREGGARRVGGWAGMTAAALLGNLTSPFGIEPLRYALVHREVPQRYIEEWFRPWILPGDPRFAPLTLGVLGAFVLCLIVGASFLLGQADARRRGGEARVRAVPWERLGFLALCLVMSLQARRFLFLGWFPALEALGVLLALRPSLAASRAVPAAAAVLLALPLASSHFVRLGRASLLEGPRTGGANATILPVHAAGFLAEAGTRGNLFHPYEWGGYLGFRLWPECLVFLDGRTVLFGEVIEERWLAERDHEVAAEVFEQRGIDVVVQRPFLAASGPRWRPPGDEGDWVRVWTDALAVVWLRADDREGLERAAHWWAGHGVELDPGTGVFEAQVLAARPAWARDRHVLHPEVLRRWERLDPDSDALAMARFWAGARMGRSARWELERWIDALAATPGREDEAARHRARLRALGPRDFLAELGGAGERER
jgi:hypothetical protein